MNISCSCLFPTILLVFGGFIFSLNNTSKYTQFKTQRRWSPTVKKKKIISIKQHVFLFYFNVQNSFFIFRKMTSHSIIRHYVAVNKNLLVDLSLRMIYVLLCGIASTRLSLSKYHPYLFIFLCNFLWVEESLNWVKPDIQWIAFNLRYAHGNALF